MAVAVSVAATETTAVVPAVIKMAFSGTGSLKSRIGISLIISLILFLLYFGFVVSARFFIIWKDLSPS